MTAAMVVEMFEPELDVAVASAEEARLAEEGAQAGVDKADERIERAREKREQRWGELQAARSETHRRESRVEERRRVALAALGATESSSSESFVAQTVIEGGEEEEAKDVLKRIRGINDQIKGEDAIRRVIVIGALPVVSEVESPNQHRNRSKVSFVDVNLRSDVGMWRTQDGRHHVNIMPGSPGNISEIGLLDRDDGVPYGFRDEDGYNRVIDVEPLELEFVTTAEEVEELVHGQDQPVPGRYGSVTVGTGETDAMKPAILTGEAVDEFTSWLARNDAMKVMVFAAAFDGEDVALPDDLRMEEDSRAMEIARAAFKDRVQGYIRDYADNSIQEDVEIPRMRKDILFSRGVQEYLGISDEELGGYIAETLQQYVSVEQDGHRDGNGVRFDVRTPGLRNFRGVEYMCAGVAHKFGEAGFELRSYLNMDGVARKIQLTALRDKLDTLPDKRSNRRFRRDMTTLLDRLSSEQQII
jgi:hypothetical protein